MYVTRSAGLRMERPKCYKCIAGIEKMVLTTQDVVCIINQCEMGDYDANQFIKAFIR